MKRNPLCLHIFLLTFVIFVVTPFPIARAQTIVGPDFPSSVVAPGSVIRIQGVTTGVASQESAPQQSLLEPPVELGGISVEINGYSVGIRRVTRSGVEATLPSLIEEGPGMMSVRAGGKKLAEFPVRIADVSPVLLELSSSTHMGRILEAKERTLGPFRLRGSEGENTTLILLATGLHNAVSGGDGVEINPPAVHLEIATADKRQWSLPVDGISDSSQESGIQEVSVTAPRELSGAGIVAVRLVVAEETSNVVYAIFASSEPVKIESLSLASAPPGSRISVKGSGFVPNSPFQGPVRTSVTVIPVENPGIEIPVRPKPGMTTGQLTFSLPPVVLPDGSWYKGPATLCVQVDGLKNCAEQISITAPVHFEGERGSLLTAVLGRMISSRIVTLRNTGRSDQADELAARALGQSQALTTIVQGLKQRNSVEMVLRRPLGNLKTVSVTREMLERQESLLAAAGYTLTSDPKPEVASANTGTNCGLSQEALIMADWRDYQNLESQLDDLSLAQQIITPLADLTGCVAGAIIGGPPGCIATLAALAIPLVTVDQWAIFNEAGIWAGLAQLNTSPIFLSSIEVTPSLIQFPGTPLPSYQSVTVDGVFTPLRSGTNAAANVAGDILTHELLDVVLPIFMQVEEEPAAAYGKSIILNSSLCASGSTCLNIVNHCPGCFDALTEFFNDKIFDPLAGYIEDKVDLPVGAGNASPVTVPLGSASLFASNNTNNAVSFTFACHDGDSNTLTALSSTGGNVKEIELERLGELLPLWSSDHNPSTSGNLTDSFYVSVGGTGLPTLQVSPTSVAQGSQTVVSGTTFPPGANVVLDWTDASGNVKEYHPVPDSSGTFAITLSIPSAAVPGINTLTATSLVFPALPTGPYSSQFTVVSLTPPAAKPSFSLASGTYSSTQTVAISDTTPHATIHCTIDGTTPTTGSPVCSGPINVSSTETIKAIATATGYSASAVATATYTFGTPAADTPTFSPAPGNYGISQTVTISDAISTAVIHYTTNGTTPTTTSPVYSSPISVSSTETIEAIATASGHGNSAVASATYTIGLLAAAAPTFSVASGSYPTPQTVSILDTTPKAIIYYTTNGATPTTASPVYSGAISVSSTETVEAIALASGYSASSLASASYIIAPTQKPGAFQLTANAPSCNPAPSTVPIVSMYWTASSQATTYYVYRNAFPAVALGSGTLTWTDPATLSAGSSYTYYVMASNGQGTTQSTPVTITIPSNICYSQPAGNISLGFSALTVNLDQGALPRSDGILIKDDSGKPMRGTISATTQSGGNWITFDGYASYTFTAPETVMVTYNPSGLPPALYSGTVTIASPQGANSPVTVPVTMLISPVLAITTSSALPDAFAGQSYSVPLQATITSGLTWTLAGGALPTGLSLNQSTGGISGTPAGVTNTTPTTFTIGVSDSLGRQALQTFTINWRQGIVISPPLGGWSPVWVLGQPVLNVPGYNFTASGGTSPYQWSAAVLPPGVMIDPNSGYLSGSPTTAGSYPVVFTVVDSTGLKGTLAVTFTVVQYPVQIHGISNQTPPALTSGVIGTAYTMALEATGGTQTGFTWSTTGNLPPGIAAGPSAGCTGSGCDALLLLSGTPTSTGVFPFSLSVTDSAGNGISNFVVLVVNQPGAAPTITQASLPLATIGTSYNYPFAATGGTGAMQWKILGPLPETSLALSVAGTLSATPALPNDCSGGPGSYLPPRYPASKVFFVEAIDSAGQADVQQFCMPAYFAKPTISNIVPTDVITDGSDKTITIVGTGFQQGSLLQVGSYSSRTPTFVSSTELQYVLSASGNFMNNWPPYSAYFVRVLAPYTQVSDSATFAIDLPPVEVSSVTPAYLDTPDTPCRTNWQCRLNITGSGFSPYTQFRLDGSSQDLGNYSTTSTTSPWSQVTTNPFIVTASGTHSMQVTNPSQPGGGSSTVTITFQVYDALAITPTPTSISKQVLQGDSASSVSLVVATAGGSGYPGTATVSGGSWLKVNGQSITSWTSPATLTVTLDPTGLSPATYNASITLYSSQAPNTGLVVPVTLVVSSALKITTTSLPDAYGGTTYSAPLQAVGGSGLSWQPLSGQLPPGLTLNSTTGLISGTPGPTSAIVPRAITFIVGDSLLRTAQQTLTINWKPGITIAIPSNGTPQWVVGTAIQNSTGYNFTPSGGTPPYTWVASGLPVGISLSSGGVLSGTPTIAGPSTAVFVVTDSLGLQGSLSVPLQVTQLPLKVVDNSFGNDPPIAPNGIVGIAYPTLFLSGSGGSQKGFQWTIAGTLPPGITSVTPPGCAPPDCPIGFSGTPTAAGLFPATLQLTDSANNQMSLNLVFAISSPPPVLSQLVFGTPPAPNVLVGGSAGSAITVMEEDPTGVLVASASDTISLTVNGPGSYSQTYTATAVGGIASFDLSTAHLTGPGNYTYIAHIGSLSSATTSETVISGTFDFGSNTLVGSSTSTQAVTLVFTSDGTLNAIQVLTQGAPNLDFSLASGSTCTVGTAYHAGQSCIVNSTFAPTVPGHRMGAITLTDGNSNVLATEYLVGAGTGPLVSFLPGSQSTLGKSFNRPFDVAVDGNNNIFVADNGDNAVYEILAAGGYTKVNSLGSGFNGPYGIAVDGSGNVFVADTGNGAVKEILAAGGYTTVNTLGSGFVQPSGVAVDGSGNVFVIDRSITAVKEILAVGGYTTVNTLGSDVHGGTGIAVDGSGNLFLADNRGAGVVQEAMAAGGYTAVKTLSNAVPLLWGIAVDGSGNVFVSDSSDATVKELLASSNFTTVIPVGTGIGFPNGFAVDGSGNVYFASIGGPTNQVVKLDFADAPNLSFASAVVGTTSSDSPQTLTLSNNGNTALTFSIPSSGSNPSISTNFALSSSGGTACPMTGSTSSSAGTLAAGASCTLPISFAPTSLGSITGTLVLTNNNLNGTNATQTISLSGTATGSAKTTPPVTVTPGSSNITTAQALTVTVAVSGTPTPTGSVTLSGGGYTSTATTLSGGSASISIPAGSLATGSDTLTASYTPDSSSSSTYNSASGSSPVTVTTPAKTTPTVTVTPTPASITTAQALTVTVAVSGGTGNPTATGSVTLSGGGYTSTATTLSSGSATINIPAGSLATGGDTLTASYTPDSASSSTYNAATGTSLTVTVTQAKTTPMLTVTPSASSITTAQALTVTVAVSGTPTPTGSVTLSGGGYTSSATTLSGGSVSINIPAGALTTGSDTLKASYTPDSSSSSTYNAAAGTSSAVTVTQAKTAPTVTVIPSSSSITTSQSLSVTIGVAGTPTPTGTVALVGGGYTSAATTLTAGDATINIPAGSLVTGTYQLTATYTPDAPSSSTYNGATGSSSVTVSASGTGLTEPVGTASSTQTATILLSSSFTLQSISVVTQGAPNLDFNIASGGTCTVGTAYTTGQTCTANFTFTPKAPGQRLGAILLMDGGGFVQAKTYISGTGTGPQVSFPPSSQSMIGSGFSSPKGISADASGNIYVADTGNNGVEEFVASSGYSTVFYHTGFNNPTGVAMDGAGNIFVADSSNNAVKEILVASGSAPYSTLGSNFNSPWAVAVDASGNVFVADSGNNAVKEILAASGYTTINTLGSGFNSPKGIALDGAGNVFVGDSGNNAVKEILAAGGYATVKTLGSGFSSPTGVAVNPYGDVLVADTGNNAVKEIFAASSYTTVNTLATGFSAPSGVAVTGNGNVFVADSFNNHVVKLDLVDAPSLGFATTTVGSTSSDSPKTVTLENIGNVALTFPIPSSGNNPSISTNFTLNSTGTTTCPLTGSAASSAGTLAAGATCTLSISFAPTVAGSLSGSLVLTDNNLNGTNATQTISVSGTATGSAKTTPVVTVTPGSSSITTAQALTVTVAVSGTPTPTGSVTLSGGGYTSTATTLSGGSASISIPAGSLATGSDTLTASYTPDSSSSSTYNTATGTSSAVTVTLAKTTPTVTVTPSASSITTAQALSVTVAVSGGTGNPTATGSVTLSGSGYTSMATTLSSGSATINIPAGSLATGSDTLTAIYSPDSNSSSTYNTATATSSAVTVTQAKTTPTVTVTPSASSITTAQALTVTVAVSGTPTPTGSVTLSGGGYTSAATTLSSGSASISIPAGSLAPGSDTLTVSYTPDSNSSSTYNSATGSNSVTVTTPAKTTPTVTVTPSASSITTAQALTVTVAVSGGTGNPTPSGTVTLSSGGYNAQQTLASGAASFTIAAGTLGNGANTLTASYSGDATYAVASSTTTVTVEPVSVTTTTPSAVSPGSSATSTVTLTGSNGYSGTMNLACTLTSSPTGAQSLPTCSLNPASVTLASGGNGTSALTVKTTAASTTALARPTDQHLWKLGGGGAVLAAVLLFGIPFRRRRWTSMLALLLLVAAAGAIGCVSGKSTSSGGGSSTPATTAGNYTFTIAATDSANAKITTSTTISVTVQ